MKWLGGYRDDLLVRLRTISYAKLYITEVLRAKDDDAFLLAVKDVADAHTLPAVPATEPVVCEECGGCGAKPTTGMIRVACPVCNGTGQKENHG